jgi:hypothetical protein
MEFSRREGCPPTTQRQSVKLIHPGETGPVPSPPLVTYLSATSHNPGAVISAPKSQFMKPPVGNAPEPARGMQTPQPMPPTSYDDSSTRDRSLPPAGSPSSDKLPSLGSPPPYIPIERQPRPAVRTNTGNDRVETQTTAPPINLRIVSALGPPPPYRPAGQVATSFGRGPAPDLEPWRANSLTRIPASVPDVQTDAEPVGAISAESEWTLIREPEPEVFATADPGQQHRLEIVRDTVPRDHPMLPSAIAARFVGPPRPIRSRSFVGLIRPLLWASAIAAVLILTGGLLDLGRHRVMRLIPATARVYVALGLFHEPIEHPDSTEGTTNCGADQGNGTPASPDTECEHRQQPSQ